MNKLKKFGAAVLSAVMLCGSVSGGCAALAESSVTVSDAIAISSVEDFAEFVKNCTLDSYSVGKKFVLTADIGLTGKSVSSVPSFGGSFDGNGHTISGLNIQSSGSALGLFRYIEKTGSVRNLIVTGLVSPSGTATECGGIAGVNRGRIIGCRFNGIVRGKEQCGGIAGLNEESGIITGSSANGRVQANHFAGGITGKNYGSVRACESTVSVNTNNVDDSIELSDLSISDIYSTENAVDMTDVGGIAGYSAGTLIGCTNRGTVGYQHVGYNIGGIAGRQDGYVSGCENYGEIYGRKDVAGIVGQAEPHFMLTYSREKLDDLDEELDKLSSLINDTIEHISDRSDVISGDFSKINSTLDDIRSDTDGVMQEADRIINADVDSVNEIMARIDDCIMMLDPVMDIFGESADDISDAFDKLSDAGVLLGTSVDSLSDGMKAIFDAMEGFSDAAKELKDSAAAVSDALSAFKKGLGDPEQMKAALEALEDDIYTVKFIVNSIADNANDLLTAIDRFENSEQTKAALDKIKAALKDISETSEKLSKDLDALNTALGKVNDELQKIYDDPDNYEKYLRELLDLLAGGLGKELADAAEAVFDDMSELTKAMSDLAGGISDLINSDAWARFKDDIDKVAEDVRKDMQHISNITDTTVTTPDIDVDELYSVIDYLKTASDGLSAAGGDIESAIDKIRGTWDYLDRASAAAIAAAYCASDAMDLAKNATDKIGSAIDEIGDIFDYFNEKPTVEFIGADNAFTFSRDTLSDSLKNLTDDLNRLNNSASVTSDILTADLKKINDQIAVIEDLIVDIIDDVTNKSTDIKDYTQDISSDDTNGYAQGKIVDSKNYGSINADVNVGGIAGSMGVENSFDPESDGIETVGDKSSNFLYKLRTVVSGCVNYGSVSAKKDGAGGIAGDMSAGCVMDSYGYGNVESTSGNCVGGVVGKSEALVVRSGAMCRVSGEDYVGGVVGQGKDITDCRAFVKITSYTEYAGAIAGYADGEISHNVFSDSDIGGIDGVSYRAKAYPMDYEKLLTLNYVPEDFSQIKLIFVADGTTVAERTYSYGDDVPDSDIPEIPGKEGCYAEWEEFDAHDLKFGAVINAEYRDKITAIATAQRRDDGLPVILVQGHFSGSDELSAEVSGGVWHIVIPDDGTYKHIVRYYSSEDPKTVDVCINGRAVESEVDGRYIVFEAGLSEFDISTAPKAVNPLIFIAAGAGAAVTVLIIIAVIIHKKKKKKASGKPSEDKNDPSAEPDEKKAGEADDAEEVKSAE